MEIPVNAAQVLAELLNCDRDKFNARFALARSRSRSLSPVEWKAVLNECVAPLAPATQQALPERAEAVVEAAYDGALELLSRNQLGPRAPGPMALLWRDVLPQIAPIVALHPRRVLNRASNALLDLQAHHLAEIWVRRLAALASDGAFAACDADVFEHAMLVLAWRCGLAHARASALKYLRALPSGLGRALIGPSDASEESWPALLERLEREPFFNPSRVDCGPERLSVVAQVGDWEVWGGAMAAPPRVLRRNGALWAWSGHLWFRLHADAFGATLSPARFDILPDKLPQKWSHDESCGAWKLQVQKADASGTQPDGSGEALHVTHGPNPAYEQAEAALLPGFDGVLSAASDEHVLAFTSRLSMRIFLVARSAASA